MISTLMFVVFLAEVDLIHRANLFLSIVSEVMLMLLYGNRWWCILFCVEWICDQCDRVPGLIPSQSSISPMVKLDPALEALANGLGGSLGCETWFTDDTLTRKCTQRWPCISKLVPTGLHQAHSTR